MKRLSLTLPVLATLALPAPAGATLVFQRGDLRPAVWTANDDGSGARRLVAGFQPHISANGATIVYGVGATSANPALRAIPTAGGTPRTVLRRWRYGAFALSPDGTKLATVTGPEIGRQRLVLVDVPTGTARTLATGYFTAASFSPAGDQVVYDRATTERPFTPTDLWIAPVAGGAPRRLTTDRHSLAPVWGPTQIAYTRWARPTGRHRREDGPKYNLALIAPDGSGRRALTHDRIPWLLTGYTPTWWSADGTRLLAQFGGQDTSYAVAVEVPSGRKHVVGPKAEFGLVGTQLSADGAQVLGFTGGFDDASARDVVTIPWQNGKPTILARQAGWGSWGTAPSTAP